MRMRVSHENRALPRYPRGTWRERPSRSPREKSRQTVQGARALVYSDRRAGVSTTESMGPPGHPFSFW